MKANRHACLVILLMNASCASITPRLGFDRVQQEVSDRSGLEVRWDTSSDEDQQAQAAVTSLLKNELTAEKAMQIALLNNRELQALYQELYVAQADLVQAGLLKNPVFSGDLRFGVSGGPPAVDMGIAQDFISLLSIPLRKARAQAAFETEKLRVAGRVLDLAGEVRGAFYEAQANEQLREMRKSVFDATAVSYELAKRLHDAGNIRDLDLSNERALHEQSRLELASAEARALTSRADLNELMGLWGSRTDWTLSGRLPDLPPTSNDKRVGYARRALDQSLDLKVAAKEIEVAARTLGITEATRFINEASIGISAAREVSDYRGVSRERKREWYNLIGEQVTNAVRREPSVWPPLSPQGAAKKYDGLWSLGPSMSLPVPLFDQGQAALTANQARLKQSIELYYALAVRLRARVQAIDVAAQSARDKAAYYQAIILPLRHRILEETQLQYNAMQVSAFQLLQAKRDEIDAGAGYIEELRRYWLAQSKLDLLLNGRMPSQRQYEISSNHSIALHEDKSGGQHNER